MKTFRTIMQEMGNDVDRSQYKVLNHAIRSVFDRKGANAIPAEPNDQELVQAQNRKIQIQRKIIDNA